MSPEQVVTSMRLAALRFRKVAHSMRSERGRRALRFGVASSMDARAALRRLQPELVLDVGANRGQFALDVLSECPTSRVVAFEPITSERKVLQEVLRDDSDRVEALPFALGAADATTDIVVTRDKDSSSLLGPTAQHAGMFPGAAPRSTESVEVRRLDQLLVGRVLPPRTFLKIDVQGSELDVLIGAGELLTAIKWVWVEVSLVELYESQALASEVIMFLSTRGFILVDLSNPVRVGGRAVQVDLLFERPG